MQKGNTTVVFGYCRNCGQKILGYRDANGLLKVECPICKTRYVSREMSRRHIVEDIYAPLGEEILIQN
ncbi:MAG: hypothetical protein E7372_05740 [Clostridiales bacterium]|nr:hypothetical protein [Clostridiales bacterium]MBE7082036.1 hypothetical protein [Clostridiales bacterium]